MPKQPKKVPLKPVPFDRELGKSFRIAKTPDDAALGANGKKLPPSKNRFSVVTPENGEAWNWPDAPPKHIQNAKLNWRQFLRDPNSRYKVDQIIRSMK